MALKKARGKTWEGMEGERKGGEGRRREEPCNKERSGRGWRKGGGREKGRKEREGEE